MIVHVLINRGQSNAAGINPGESGTYPAVRHWYSDLPGTDDTAWGDLTTGIGKDVSLGRVLNEAGVHCAILTCARGATSSVQWLPGNTAWNSFEPDFTQALSLLAAEYPANTVFRYWDVVDQGEAEARNTNLAVVQAWAENFETTHAAIEEILGTSAERIVIQTNSNIDGKTFPGVLEAEQLAAAGSASRLVNRNDVEYESDGVHMTTAGYIETGELVAAAILEIINMGTLSTFARTALVDHARNKGTYSAAANHYCAAFVAGVEVTGGSYARATLANDKTTWGDAASRAITNDVAFVFPDASASWGTIDEIRIFDASSGGNELARHTLALGVPISDSTGPLEIPIGSIDITFPAGGFTNTVVHELLDLMFGATANTPRATVHGTYFAGDPQGAGVETSAARTSITQATTWGAASAAGLAKTIAPIALADESDATYYAEYTAGSGGTLLFSAAIPASGTPPSGGIIPAGGLRTSLT